MQTNKEMIDYLRSNREDAPSKIFDAMEIVDRMDFLPEFARSEAYSPWDALSIGYEQTCSAPEVVALMCKYLELEKGQKVLEVGTGCGYHASVAAEIIDPGKIISLDIIPELVNMARENISRAKKKLGRNWNIEVVYADGSEGYEKEKPYNSIYFTAGVPEEYSLDVLSDQLVEGGRCLLAPRMGTFKLGVKKNGKINAKYVGDLFGFVPLKGKYGFK